MFFQTLHSFLLLSGLTAVSAVKSDLSVTTIDPFLDPHSAFDIFYSSHTNADGNSYMCGSMGGGGMVFIEDLCFVGDAANEVFSVRSIFLIK
jgi:hypothetical protein